MSAPKTLPQNATSTIKGKTVSLRYPVPADDEEMGRILSDPLTMQYLEFMLSEWTPDTARTRRESKGELQSKSQALSFNMHVINDAGIEELAGPVGFREIDLPNRFGELGIILHHPFWGKGIATEALYLCLKYGFEELHLHRVVLSTAETNNSMRGWLEKVAKINLERIEKDSIKGDSVIDWCIYAVFEDEWPDVRKRLETKLKK